MGQAEKPFVPRSVPEKSFVLLNPPWSHTPREKYATIF